MDKSSIDKALAEARALVASLEAYDGTPLQHMSLLRDVDGIRATLEEPYDTATRWLENMSVSAAVNILNRIGAYDHFPQTGTITAIDLAAKCNVDVSVVTRSMRIAIGNNIFSETGPDEYSHNKLSLALGPAALGGFVGVCNDLMKAWVCVPEYAKTHQPEDLYDVKKTPFAFAAGHEGKTYYEVLDLNPAHRLLWNLTLQSMDKNFPVIGMFPFKDLEPLAKDEANRPLLVDVGGGRGQALLIIREHVGDVFDGKMILQDLPVVIDSLKQEDLPGIKPMSYDIFTPQPVKNAHVYFMRRLLHDFYDPDVKTILKNTVSAMGSSSRLIISDMLVPETVNKDGPMTLYWLDLSLLAIGGQERTIANFRSVLDEVGLELTNVYKSVGSDIAMLETRVKVLANGH